MHQTGFTIAPNPGSIEIKGARQNNLKGFRSRTAARQVDRRLGTERLRQVEPRFRHDLRGGTTALRRDVFALHAPVHGAHGQAEGGRDPRHPARHRHRAGQSREITRSTVGTMTEINDYLKLLLPRVMQAFCPSCEREIRPETAKSIADEVFAAHPGATRPGHFRRPGAGGTRHRRVFSTFSNSRATCASGQMARCIGSTRRRGSSGCRRSFRSFRIGWLSRKRIVRAFAKRWRPRFDLARARSPLCFRRRARTPGGEILPFSHRLALRALRSGYRSAVAGIVFFQSSARRLPDVPWFRAHHRH